MGLAMSKVQCCKEQHYIGTWNIRSMNQGKLDTVKQEMARVNLDILGVSDKNGQEWENLTQMIITSTIVGKNHLEEMEYPSGSRAEFKMQCLGAASKITELSQFIFKVNHSKAQ